MAYEDAYEHAFSECDPSRSELNELSRDEFLSRLRTIYGAKGVTEEDIADALVRHFETVDLFGEAQTPGVKEAWRKGCLEALKATPG